MPRKNKMPFYYVFLCKKKLLFSHRSIGISETRRYRAFLCFLLPLAPGDGEQTS